MTKVCVVTLFKHNYGAFLQAYASQRFLETLGYEAEVLDYDYYRDRTVLGVYVGRIKKPVSFCKNIIYKLTRYRVSRQRDIIMEQCAQETIKQTKNYRSYKLVKKNPPDADIFIVGSDQVWNPGLSEQGFLSRLLEFVPDSNKVLCSYAASVGRKTLSEKAKNLFTEHLKRFDCISVRETDAVSIIGKMTEKSIEVHKDPALLLNAIQWNQFAKKIDTDRPYIFLYLAQKSQELVAFAEKMARDNNWGIVDCHANVNYRISNSINGDRLLSPMEFVGGIKDAAYVVTNSFHCLVFAIHYQKKAYVKIPPKGSSRLTELLEDMKLERLTDTREICQGEQKEIYQYAQAYLDAERQRARDYLINLKNIKKSKNE